MRKTQEIDLGDVVVFPALVNSHDHLEFNLYPRLGDPPYADVDGWSRDVRQRHAGTIAAIESIPFEIRSYWGLLKNLSWGVTAVMNHAEPQRNVPCDFPLQLIGPYRFVHRADERWAWLRARFDHDDGPLVFHVAEGTSGTVAKNSARFLRRLHASGPLVGVHGIKLTPDDARYLDALVWCPASNLFLFGQTADIAALKDATEILFGTDATISAQGTIWDHLRTARGLGYLSDAELLECLTTRAARIWGLDNSGDMVIARRRHPDPWESLYQLTPADICAVISQHRLVLMSESFFENVAIDAWQRQFRAVTIGNVSSRLYCPAPTVLERLAAIDNAPVSLQSL